MNQPRVETQREVGDEVRQTTCYMCACRCGIDVHIKDGKVRYLEEIIEGLEQAPAALIGLLKGDSFGKRVIHLAS